MSKKILKNTTYRPGDKFGTVVHADIQRSTFNRNCTHITTFQPGKLIPIYVDEILPGDTVKIDTVSIARMLNPITATMDRCDIEYFAFFTPNRLVWTGWEELQGENKTGAWAPQSPPALVPQIRINKSYLSGSKYRNSVASYFGIGVPDATNLTNVDFPVSVLPFRAYVEIYNEWFRNQNLQAPIAFLKNNVGEKIWNFVDPIIVNKPFDYFTSCLPEPQKGESVLLPIELGNLIPVVTKEASHNLADYPLRLTSLNDDLATSKVYNLHMYQSSQGDGTLMAGGEESESYSGDDSIVPKNLYADTGEMTFNALTIHELRTAFQVQKLFERDARGGTRYIEMLKSHFGVESEDYRLQRPELLGVNKFEVGIYQVPQTSSTDAVSPQGNIGAFSYSGDYDKEFVNKSFVEHGILMILAVARQRKTYQQGVPRMFMRKDRLDFYMPVMANISEQPVYTQEIYSGAPEGEIFGYNEAWADYRYKPSYVSGHMLTKDSHSRDVFHYADYYSQKPVLSDSWMKDNSAVNIERTLAVRDVQIINLEVTFLGEFTRPMPIYSIPGLVDHF